MNGWMNKTWLQVFCGHVQTALLSSVNVEFVGTFPSRYVGDLTLAADNPSMGVHDSSKMKTDSPRRAESSCTNRGPGEIVSR